MKHLFFAPRLWMTLLCGAAALALSAAALADPPDRVARLAQIQGAVSFSPAGEEDWAIADANRPVTTGDRVWADADSHAELQMGDAAARLGSNTAVTVLNLDDRIGQFQLAQGSLNVRVRQISNDQFYEVDTPTLAFSIRRAGDYRIDVDPSGNTTILQVRAGQGEAWGEGTSYVIDPGQQYTFSGPGMQDYRYDPLPAPDAFDRWCQDRNRREDAAIASASRYVSPAVVGYSDLDEYGTWRNVEGYGNVWVPTRVEADWVPYHYGRWSWVEPWGWTWIDDAPWGFAPFHYGRWAYLSNHWCWVPGPVRARPVYAPALVAFVGGNGFSIAVGGGPVSGVAWFPLGVGEVYRPSYEVSRTYFTNVNVTNTVVNTTYVTNVYNNQNVEINYRNRQVAGAVTAVPVNAFASGERVERHAVRVQQDVVARAQVAPVPAVTPTHAAVLAAGAAAAGAAVASHRPPRAALERQVVARTEPPAPKPSFAQRAPLLSSQPGRPLDTEKMRSVRAERSAEAPRVKVVAPRTQPQPIEAAKGGPQRGPSAQEDRAMNDRRGRPEAGGPQANVPQPPASAQDRSRGGAQGPTAQEDRAMKDRRGRPEAGGPQANVPQPPAAAQDRFRGGAQGPTAQEDRAMKDRRGRPEAGGPQANVPQPPAAAQDRFRGGAQGPTAQEDRTMKDRRGRPEASGPQANVPQPPAAAQERSRGGPQGQSAAQERAQQERAQQERAAQQGRAQQDRAQQERAQQERNQQQERARQERAQQDQRSQMQQQQRAQAQAEQQRAQQERVQAQAQQRAQQERAQAQAQQRSQAQAQERAQAQAQQQRAQAQAQAQQRAQAQAQERAQVQAQQRAQAQAQQRPQQEGQQAQRAQPERGRAQAQQEKEKEREQQQRGG